MQYKEEFCALCREIGCRCRQDEPLSSHTTFRIGGNAEAVAFINSQENLRTLLEFVRAHDIRFFVMGKGSNILASDDGFDGVILKISSDFSAVRLMDNDCIYCEAGASLIDVCRFALENSLTGLEFAYGIPGTAGGGLFMNAGAYGGEMKDVVQSAHYIDEKGETREITLDDMKLSYRRSIFSEDPGMIITDMTLRLKKGNRDSIKERMDELMGKRRDKQPLEYPSAGSTFKRPEGSYASLLIEQCGLKGLSAGGAQVSEKHSGFVINKGGASFRDVTELCEKVRETVLEKTGYDLELEPIILK